MKKAVRDYLQDLLNELDDIIIFSSDGERAFMQDAKTQKAVIRSYEVIGEITKRLPDQFRLTNPQIDWRKLITFRDFLAHNYELIALRYVWAAVEDARNLRVTIQTLIDSLPAEDELL
ncbi:HepT-like ribonuclease domain-containing protein [Aggregatilineales bacterium SYSU G02658]